MSRIIGPTCSRGNDLTSKPHSPQTAEAIDSEVRGIIDECYGRAKQLIEDNIDKLHNMADALIEYETLGVEQIEDIMAGAKPREPGDGATPTGKSPPGESPIGDPAGEH